MASKKSSKSSKSRTFAAVTADELQYEDMDFDKWGADLFDDADEALIRKYILDEAEAVKQQKENDVSSNTLKRWNLALFVVLNI